MPGRQKGGILQLSSANDSRWGSTERSVPRRSKIGNGSRARGRIDWKLPVSCRVAGRACEGLLSLTPAPHAESSERLVTGANRPPDQKISTDWNGSEAPGRTSELVDVKLSFNTDAASRTIATKHERPDLKQSRAECRRESVPESQDARARDGRPHRREAGGQRSRGRVSLPRGDAPRRGARAAGSCRPATSAASRGTRSASAACRPLVAQRSGHASQPRSATDRA